MSSAAPRLEFLLRRLILLAGEVRDSLVAGDWEVAAVNFEEFDEAFAAFQSRVDGGERLGPRHEPDLAQLAQAQAENEHLARQLRAAASAGLEDLSRVRKIGGYAPLGANHKPGPRYVDGSA